MFERRPLSGHSHCISSASQTLLKFGHEPDAWLGAATQNETYYETFMNMFTIARCYFMKALHRAEEPLALVANCTTTKLVEAANATVMQARFPCACSLTTSYRSGSCEVVWRLKR